MGSLSLSLNSLLWMALQYSCWLLTMMVMLSMIVHGTGSACFSFRSDVVLGNAFSQPFFFCVPVFLNSKVCVCGVCGVCVCVWDWRVWGEGYRVHSKFPGLKDLLEKTAKNAQRLAESGHQRSQFNVKFGCTHTHTLHHRFFACVTQTHTHTHTPFHCSPCRFSGWFAVFFTPDIVFLRNFTSRPNVMKQQSRTSVSTPWNRRCWMVWTPGEKGEVTGS
jgi:hypothetical protein